MVRLLVQAGVSESFASGENQGVRCCQGEELPQIKAHLSTQDVHAHTCTHHKTAQQSRGGMMDRDSKTEDGSNSEPAFDLS